MSINPNCSEIAWRLESLRGLLTVQHPDFDEVHAIYAQLRALEMDLSHLTSLYGHKLAALRAGSYVPVRRQAVAK